MSQIQGAELPPYRKTRTVNENIAHRTLFHRLQSLVGPVVGGNKASILHNTIFLAQFQSTPSAGRETIKPKSRRKKRWYTTKGKP